MCEEIVEDESPEKFNFQTQKRMRFFLGIKEIINRYKPDVLVLATVLHLT